MGLRPNFLFKLLFLLAFSTSAIAQNSALAKWTAKYDKTKAFIENKGQFKVSGLKNYNTPVLYAMDHGATKIYFTKKGLVYSFLNVWQKETNKEEREKREQKGFASVEEFKAFEEEGRAVEYSTDVIPMFFDGANPAVEIIAEQQTKEYHSYSFIEKGETKDVSNVKAFKKIAYKNIYPNIDIEYTFHPESGIKYAIILHPGADASMIKMKYDKSVSLNKNNLLVPTKFGDIIDHAPLTFYANDHNKIVRSSFALKGNIVSFKIGKYDHTKTLIIDPWTQTPAFATNWDCVWECERDGAGNVYIIGGVMPMQLLKYNTTGVLQWTYNTPYDTSNCWLGTLATDLAGNSYVTRGSVSGIQKISTAGALIWNNNGGGGSIGNSDEYWTIAFNCDQTKLIVGGTSGAFGLPPVLKAAIFQINTGNGNIISTQDVAVGSTLGIPPNVQEVRSLSPARSGQYYFLTQDTIGYINQNFSLCPGNNPSLYKTTSTYDWGYKCEDYKRDNSSVMAIKANSNFVYTHNGNAIHKRNLATGAIVATATITGGGNLGGFGGNQVQNSGIDIDDCGNVYVGSGNGIIKFDSNLNVLSSVATTYRVYDLQVSTGGDVVVCGSTGNSGSATRTGTVQVVNMGACASLALICCDATICAVGPFCTTSPSVTLTVATSGGTFSGPGVNPTTGVFNPATAGPGTHTITYTLACGSESIQITVSSCGAMSVCNNGGTLQLTGGAPSYSWVSTQTTLDCSSCFGGNCIPFVCPGVTVPVWTGTGTSVTAPTAGQFPINVTDGVGTVLNIPTLAGIPACASCPTITVSGTPTNIQCVGQTGSASVSASGSTTSYTYNWMPGNLTGASQTSLAAGTYTVTATDGNSCTGTTTITITQPASAVSVSISSTTPTACSGATGAATASGSGGTGTITYNWMPGNISGATISNQAAGTYTVTATDANGCTATTTATITQAASTLAASISGTTPATCGSNNGSATATSTGGVGTVTYSWMPGSLTGATISNQAAGTYTVTATDANGCTATATATIASSGGPTASIASQTNILCFGQNTGAATATSTGGTGTITYTWMPGSLTGATQTGLAAGTYTVTASDGGSCPGTTTVTITQPTSAVSVSITATTPTACGSNNGAATASAMGGTGTITYSWMPGSLSGASISNQAAGTYTVTATDANGCTATTTATIASSGGPSISITSQTNILCNGGNNGSATASATGGSGTITYSWSGGAGSNPTASNLSAGTYTVTATDGTGCSNSITVTITQPAAIVVSVSTTPATCGNSDGTATVNASGGNGVLSPVWNTSATNSSITGLAAGTYSVTITDASGCTATSSGTVGVTGSLSGVSAGTDVTILSGTNTVLNGSVPAGATILWTPSTGLSCTTCEDPTASPTQTTTYIITATQSGCSGSDTVTVFVDIVCGELFVPNAFSPNEDGQNDFLYVMGNCITNLEFFIYDRWGEKVFETKDAAYGWDGTYRGKKMDAAVFVYYLTATVNGQEVTKQGNITLIK